MGIDFKISHGFGLEPQGATLNRPSPKASQVLYNSTISACEKGAQWPFALQLLVDMPIVRATPNQVHQRGFVFCGYIGTYIVGYCPYTGIHCTGYQIESLPTWAAKFASR